MLTEDCSELATVQFASTESHNSITGVLVEAVTTASTLEIELWFSVPALLLLQVHGTVQNLDSGLGRGLDSGLNNGLDI